MPVFLGWTTSKWFGFILELRNGSLVLTVGQWVQLTSPMAPLQSQSTPQGLPAECHVVGEEDWVSMHLVEHVIDAGDARPIEV